MMSDVSVDDLQCRMDKYLETLKSAEAEGNTSKIRRYTRIVKQYKDAIKLCQNGRPFPVDELPNPPGFEPLVKTQLAVPGAVTPSVSPRSSPRPSPRPSPLPQRKDPSPTPMRAAPPIPTSTDLANQIGVPEPPIIIHGTADETNLEETLTARLDVYKNVLDAAETEGNSGKIRRYKRIIKQFEDAIDSYRKGKEVVLEELPNPPGYESLVPVKSTPPSPTPDDEMSGSDPGPPPPVPIRLPPKPIQKPSVSRADKQTALLKERQLEYKEAAIAAKKRGQLSEAKEFLKLYKGFDRLIQASESGLPVDLSTIPISLKTKSEVEESYHVITESDFKEGSESEIYETLEKELEEQIKMCLTTRNTFKVSGDIANANRFEQFGLHFKKDLNHVKACHAGAQPVPKFHYETKSFSIIKCNADLNDKDLELVIVQGINYNVSNPEEVDTYITYEFPHPSDNMPSGKTSLVKNTNNPKYNSRHLFVIHRDSRQCQRIFKRGGIKLEVWSKGGFFQSDTLLGTVVVKLTPLSTDNNIHEVLDLMNGRRPAGGKLEIKVRVRDPIFSKKLDTVSEKWLIIDYKL